jgi:hypothetical protein
VNAIEDVSSKTPCHTLTILACTNAIIHPPSKGIVATPESADIVTPACADVVTPECVDVGLTAASSSLRPPNPGEGILASQPFKVPLLGNPVRINVQHNSKSTSTGSRRVIPSPASQ